MPDLWSDLLACLDLHPVPSGGTGEEHAGDDVTEFEGRNQQLDYHRVFGGQLLGQLLRIASITCPDKAVKSQHTVFTREGRADEPIRYQATRQHAGRSFANITITARQSRGVVATSSICMHAPEDGPEHQSVDEVPAVLGPDREVALDLIPWETRAVVDLNVTTTGPPQFEVWMRTPAVDQELATIWFHRPFSTDGWLLLRQHSPLLAHGRSFGRGDVLGEDGSLVASYAQEALLRFAS